jgi:hypothetical protein
MRAAGDRLLGRLGGPEPLRAKFRGALLGALILCIDEPLDQTPTGDPPPMGLVP